MYICDNCGKEVTIYYGSGRFCSEHCARSFSTKNKTKGVKEVKCTICQNIFVINKHASAKNYICETCKSLNTKFCLICGKKLRQKNKSGYCKNCLRYAPEL